MTIYSHWQNKYSVTLCLVFILSFFVSLLLIAQFRNKILIFLNKAFFYHEKYLIINCTNESNLKFSVTIFLCDTQCSTINLFLLNSRVNVFVKKCLFMLVHWATRRARLSQEWAQSLMCFRDPVLNRPKNLNIFGELKNIMWTYKLVLTGNVSFDSF